MIGYGAMLAESMVAIMALVAACVLEPGAYFAMNAPAALVGSTVDAASAAITGWGFPDQRHRADRRSRMTWGSAPSWRAPAAPPRWPSACPASCQAHSAGAG